MQFGNYKIADVRDKSEIIERLAKVEDEISKDIGKDVVLIAYQREDGNSNNI